jgi:hypothetical protein
MTKRGGHRQRVESKAEQAAEGGAGFQWIPLWGWALIFLLPLLLSEFMFWRVGKIPSMIVFPVAWIGFWIAVMERSGWPILKNRRGENKSTPEEDG